MRQIGIMAKAVALAFLSVGLVYAQGPPQQQQQQNHQDIKKPPSRNAPTRAAAPQKAQRPARSTEAAPQREARPRTAARPQAAPPRQPVRQAAPETRRATPARPAQTEPRQQAAHPARPARSSRPAAAPARRAAPQAAPAPRHAQMNRSAQQRSQQEAQQRSVWQQHRAAPAVVNRSWRQRGGYQGQRIPTAYYSGHFGRNHAFRVYSLPFLVVGGMPRFQYNGYWFNLVEPVPAYWPTDWYQDDDVYVVYMNDGYYLFDSRFASRPGIAISVTF